MAEYLKILNNDGNVIIDDSFQNYHFVAKHTIAMSQFTASSRFNGGGYYCYEHTFTVNATAQPLIAYRANTQDITVLNISYTETSTNVWTVRIYLHTIYVLNLPSGTLTLYRFGLLTSSDAPSTGAVFQVRNAANLLIFDSGRKPMRVCGYINVFGASDWKQVSPGVIPASFSEISWTIPNYSSSNTYAVIPCSRLFTTMYSDPNVFYHFISYAYRDGGVFKIALTIAGLSSLTVENYANIEGILHADVIIDVTNY